MPKGSNYTVTVLNPGPCYAINFDVFDTLSADPFAFDGRNSSLYLDCFRHADSLWTTKPQGYQMKCKALLYEILFQMQKEYRLSYLASDKVKLLQPAMEEIHRSYAETNLSIEDLSYKCGISSVYFRRLFMQIHGVSPLKYINALKISRAKELLASELYTVGEVCQLSGYRDDAYFSREFKKATGVSPSAYP